MIRYSIVYNPSHIQSITLPLPPQIPLPSTLHNPPLYSPQTLFFLKPSPNLGGGHFPNDLNKPQQRQSEGLLGHYVVEVLSGDLAAVGGGPLQHLLQLLHVHGLAQLLRHPPDVVRVDEARVVVVEQVEDLVDARLNHHKRTLDSLSPNRDVIPSRNSSKSTYRPSDSRSAIMLKIVGFLVQKPKLCMADFNSLGSILPVASVSKRLKASLSSSTSSSVSPGRSTFFLAGPLATGFPLVAIRYIVSYPRDKINLKYQINPTHIFDSLPSHPTLQLHLTYIHLSMAEIAPSSSQLPPPVKNITSAWYGRDEELYLMHAQDVTVKMNRNSSDNATLKNNLELYILRAEQIEKSITEASRPPTPFDAKKIDDHKREIQKIETAIEEEVAAIKKQDGEKTEVTAENKNLFSYVQAQAVIYNETLVRIEPLFRPRLIFGSCPKPLPAEWLEGSDQEDHNQDKINSITSTINNHTENIVALRERQQRQLVQNEEQKQTCILSIQNFYENKRHILPDLQSNLKENMTSLEQLNRRQQLLDLIDADIFKAKTSYDCKLANIIELRNIIALRNRERQDKLSEMLDHSELQQPDSINQSYDEAPSPLNTKVVFPKQQPPHLWRTLLLVWFAVLSLMVIWLTLDV